MMTPEEKQLLLIDLCARLPHEVKFTLSSDNIYTMKGIDLIVTDEGDWEYAVIAKGIDPIEIEYIKPYLRPLSSMTKKEKTLMSAICLTNAFGNVEGAVSELSDFYNSRHFDYRGLIPKGLALEAHKDMYKTE